VIDALETAERAQLIAEVPAEKGSAFSFVHGLIPTTLVEGLRTLQLRGLHARAAAAIEEQRPDDFEALAYHYVQAGLAPKAITYLLRAGDRARSLYAHQEAIDHYLQALDFSEGAEPQLRARTWMRLGLTYHNAFQFSAARQAYEKGFALWQQVAETQRQPDAAPAPHALRLSWSNPLTLDPSMAADGASAAVIEELFDGLVNRSPEMEVIPAVARSWEVLEGGTRYVFHLRGDVLWSDGVQLTAGDFEYAWRRVLDPAIGSPHASFLYDVAGSRAFHEGQASWDDVGVRAADERTLVVDLEGPRGHFLQLLAHVATYPLPRHKVEALGGAWAALGNVVNNGPFVLQEWKSGESMTFDRNPRYYGRREGNVQRVQISLQPEPESVLQLYEQDQLDIVGLSPRVINRARHLHAGEYVSLPSPSTYYLAFDVTHPPFDNVPVRRAFSLATDKEGLADVAHRGFSFPATGGLVPPGVPGHSPDSGLPYDPEAARQLLAEAGLPGGRGFPTVTMVASAGRLVDAQFLQARWREALGVEVGLETAKAASDPARGAQLVNITFGGWHADYPDPENFLRVGLPWQLTGWRNAAYEELLADAQRMTAQSERMKAYQRADRLLIAEAPIIPLAYGSWHLLIKPWVRQFPMSSIKLWFGKTSSSSCTRGTKGDGCAARRYAPRSTARDVTSDKRQPPCARAPVTVGPRPTSMQAHPRLERATPSAALILRRVRRAPGHCPPQPDSVSGFWCSVRHEFGRRSSDFNRRPSGKSD